MKRDKHKTADHLPPWRVSLAHVCDSTRAVNVDSNSTTHGPDNPQCQHKPLLQSNTLSYLEAPNHDLIIINLDGTSEYLWSSEGRRSFLTNEMQKESSGKVKVEKQFSTDTKHWWWDRTDERVVYEIWQTDDVYEIWQHRWSTWVPPPTPTPTLFL